MRPRSQHRAAGAAAPARLGHVFPRLDSNQDNRLQRTAGCQLPHGGGWDHPFTRCICWRRLVRWPPTRCELEQVTRDLRCAVVSDQKPELGQSIAVDRASSDEVDALIDAWRRERPDVSVEPLAVLSRVTRLARLVDRARREAFAEHDLDLGDFDVLAALRRAGSPYQLSAGALGASTMVTSGTMTHRIDRLVVRGLVQRQPDPQDGRGVLVRLTDVGRAGVDSALDSLLRQERDLLAHMSATEQSALAAQLRLLLLPLEEV